MSTELDCKISGKDELPRGAVSPSTGRAASRTEAEAARRADALRARAQRDRDAAAGSRATLQSSPSPDMHMESKD